MNFCTNCGAQLSPNSKFCSGCGNKVSVGAGAATNNINAQQMPKPVNSSIHQQPNYPPQAGYVPSPQVPPMQAPPAPPVPPANMYVPPYAQNNAQQQPGSYVAANKPGGHTASGTKATPGQIKTMSLSRNVAGLLCYVLGWISGLIFILVEKEDRFVRFHAMQSIVVFGGLQVLNIALGFFGFLYQIPILGSLLSFIPSIIHLAMFVLWAYLMYKAYNYEYCKIPLAGDLAESFLNKHQ